jgi:hypothetical protein
MKYVDEKIETLNPKSVDRHSLHNKINTQIVANIKKIALLDHRDTYKEIDRIVNSKLLEELSKRL